MGPRVSHIKYRNLYAGSAKCGQTARIDIEKSCQLYGSLPLANYTEEDGHASRDSFSMQLFWNPLRAGSV